MKKSKELEFEVLELIGPIKENKNSNWCKYIARISYNNKPANIDLRNIQFKEDGTYFLGKGISLTDEECDVTVDTLLERGYGTIDQLEYCLNKRKSIFAGDFFTKEEIEEDRKKREKLKVKLGRDE